MTVRQTSGSIDVQWDGANWTAETDNFLKASGRARQVSRTAGWLGIGSGGRSQALVEMRNAEGRYSADNTNSPLSGSISDGQIKDRKVRIRVGINNTTCTIFTGYIRDHVENAEENMVFWTLEDRSALLTDHRMSSSLLRDLGTGSYAQAILEDAGLAAGDMVISNGYARLPFAWMDDEGVWQELGAVAEVEGGRVYVDQLGRVVFEDSTGLLLSGSQLGGADDCDLSGSDFGNLIPQYDWQNHYNFINVEYIGRSEGRKSVVYESDETLVIHPGETVNYIARLDQPLLSLDTPLAGADYYARSAGGLDTSSSLTLTQSACAQKVNLSFENTGSIFTTFITDLQLVGIPLAGQHSGVASASSGSSITRWGPKTWEFPKNPYIQDRVMAQYIADFMVDRLEEPRRVWESVRLPGSPNAWPGTRVKICETTRTGTTACGIIVETAWQMGPGFSMDLTVIVDDIFVHAASAYTIIDVDDWDSATVLWY